MYANEYYRSTLDGDLAEIYFSLDRFIPEFEKEIKVPAASISELSKVFEMYKLDHPEVFYVSGLRYRFGGESFVTCLPEYCFEKKQTEELIRAMNRRLDKLLAPASAMDGVRAFCFAREWILENVTYEKLYKNYSHEIYGVLSHGIGVCEGISKTLKAMLDRLGTESLTVIGEKGADGFRHAWNIVYLGGKPRHFDLTFDLSRIKRGLRPKYINMTDEEIFKDHTASVYTVPKCE